MNDPITCIRSSANTSGNSSHSQSTFNQGYRSQQGQGHSSQSFGSRPRYSHAVASPQVFNQDSVSCFYCNQSHLMTTCKGFLSLSLNDRRQFCYSQRLCFGCLRHGHSNRDCRKRMQCSTCNGQHPTVLHDDNRPQRSNFSQVTPLMPPVQPDRPPRTYFEASCPVQFQSTNKGVGSSRPTSSPQQGSKTATSNKVNTTNFPVSQHISAMIVPVYLSHTSYPDKKKLV